MTGTSMDLSPEAAGRPGAPRYAGFWMWKGATPGKMMCRLRIIDARKQRWHDKVVGTLVVHRERAA